MSMQLSVGDNEDICVNFAGVQECTSIFTLQETMHSLHAMVCGVASGSTCNTAEPNLTARIAELIAAYDEHTVDVHSHLSGLKSNVTAIGAMLVEDINRFLTDVQLQTAVARRLLPTGAVVEFNVMNARSKRCYPTDTPSEDLDQYRQNDKVNCKGLVGTVMAKAINLYPGVEGIYECVLKKGDAVAITVPAKVEQTSDATVATNYNDIPGAVYNAVSCEIDASNHLDTDLEFHLMEQGQAVPMARNSLQGNGAYDPLSAPFVTFTA
jgi:hypothetical protein